MKIAILGTGTVGCTLANKLVELNHELYMGTRNVEKSLSKSFKELSLADWLKERPNISLVTFEKLSKRGMNLLYLP